MPPSHDAADELRDLRRTMRDLVALSTLPAIWTAAGPDGIARGLADVLAKTLGLDLIYIRLRGQSRDDVIEVVRSRHRSHAGDAAQQVGRALAPLLEAAAYDAPPPIPDPLGNGTLRTAVIRFGHTGDDGVLVAGSQRPDFPTEADRLLLGVGANQTAIVLQRKRAEQAFQKEREWLSVTLASIGDAVIATDTEGRVTFLNAVAQSLTGWTQGEAAGRPLEAVFPIINEQTRRPVENPVEKVLRDGVIVGLANHTVLISRDGTPRPIDDSAAPIRDQGGNVVGVVLVFRDVTAQRRLERQNAERGASARFLAAIVASSDDAIISKSLDGTIQSWNVAAERLFGYTAEQAVGRHISLIIPADRIVEEDRIIAHLRAGERIDHFDTVRVRSDGRPVHVSLTISPIKDETGRVVGASKIARDVTERKRAEQERREHELRFRTLVEQVRDYAIFLMDTQGRATSWNEGVRRVLGFEEAEFIGQDIVPTIFTPEDVQAGVPRQELEEAAATGTAGNDRWMRRKDGTRFFANGTTTGLRNESGELIGFMKVMRDQTEQRRLEDELRRVAADLSEADNRKDEFLATLAHELRNPLASIRMGLELMRLAGEDRAMAAEAHATMEGQTMQLVRLVDDLLDVSRITSGKVTLRKERVELAAVVQSAVQATRPAVEVSGHELTVTLPPEPIPLDADPIRLAQVFSNLLTNAARYTLDGGRIWLTAELGTRNAERGTEDSEAIQDGGVAGSGAQRMALPIAPARANPGLRKASDPATRPNSAFVEVTIKDTGIGIPADMLGRIFEMFTQVDQSLDRSQSGLGIGLTLVKRLVEMHGGSVAARSEGPGRGSEFIVRLPALIEPVPQPQPTNNESAAASGRLRILVVDDNKDAARMLGMLLRTMGNEVRTAHDGLEALDAAAAFRPAIVLMDIGMPRLSGYDTARRLREQPWGRTMTLVALTGWGQDEDKQRTKDAGFDHHFVKPVEPAALRKLLAEQRPRSV